MIADCIKKTHVQTREQMIAQGVRAHKLGRKKEGGSREEGSKG